MARLGFDTIVHSVSTLSGLTGIHGGYSVTTTLTSSGGAKSTSMFSLASDSLKISNSGTTLAVNLEWGTF